MKKILALILTGMLVFAFCSCGDEEVENTTSAFKI